MISSSMLYEYYIIGVINKGPIGRIEYCITARNDLTVKSVVHNIVCVDTLYAYTPSYIRIISKYFIEHRLCVNDLRVVLRPTTILSDNSLSRDMMM